MYDNRLTSHLYTSSHPSDTLTTPGKTLDILESIPPPETDNLMFKLFAPMPTNREAIPVPPQALTMTPLRFASPASSEVDSECSDDGSSSPCSLTGEECPDLCGGPKNSCRSWTPPASPFYYTDEGGIFLLDDRQNFEERQKIELEHMLRDLDARLQRLEATVSPRRFLTRLGELEISTPSPPRGKAPGPGDRFLPSPAEGFAEHSQITTSPGPFPCDCNGTTPQCKSGPTQNACPVPSDHTMDTLENCERSPTDLGKLIHTSLKHVQSTNSPPKYLANVSEIDAQPLLREQLIIPDPHEGLRDGTSLMKHVSPKRHLGNTAYPTPLPSSPETKPNRKRGRDEGSQEGRGRKRRRAEDDELISEEWALALWGIRNKHS